MSEVVINTKLNTDGVKNGAKEIVKSMEQAADKSTKAMQSIEDSTNDIDVGSIERELNKLKKHLEELTKQQGLAKSSMAHWTEAGGSTTDGQYKETAAELKLIEDEMANVNAKIAEYEQLLNGSSGTAAAETKEVSNAMKDVAQSSEQAADDIEDVGDVDIHPEKFEGLRNLFNAIAVSAKFLGKTAINLVKKGFSGLKGVVNSLANGLRKLGDGFKSLFSRMTKSNGGFKSGLRNILKYALGITTLVMLFNKLRAAIKEGLGNLAKYDTRTNESLSTLKSSLDQLKNSLATAFAPILTTITPILNAFIQQIITVVNSLAQLFAMLAGQKTFIKATAVQEDYAESLNKTAGAAKKASNALGMDELNILNDDSGSGGGASSSDMFEEVATPDSSEFIDNLTEMWKNADFSALGLAIAEKINAALIDIPWDAIKSGAAKFATSLATFLNGFIQGTDWGLVGSTIAEGFNTAIIALGAFITAYDWRTNGAALGEGIQSWFATIDWSMAGKTLGDGIIGLFNSFSAILQAIDWQGIGDDIADFFKGINWVGVVEAIAEGLGSALGALAGMIFGLFGDIGVEIGEYFKEKGDEWGGNIWMGLGMGILEALANIGMWVREHIFQPFIDAFCKCFGIHSPSTVMAEMGGYLVQGLVNGLGDIWSKVKVVFEKLLTGIEGIMLKIKNVIVGAFGKIRSGILFIVENIKSVVLAVMKALASALEPIAKTIEDVWDFLCKSIGTVVYGIASGIQGLINIFIDAINAFIHTLNKVKIKVPAVLGGGTIGFDIKDVDRVTFADELGDEIPHFASGAVVPRSANEFMAVLGDNNQETEVVSPLSTMQSAMIAALTDAGFMDYLSQIASNTRVTANKDFTVNLDDRTVARSVKRGQQAMGREIISI